MTSGELRMRVHNQNDLRLDGVLRLIEEAGRPGTLQEVLTHLCEQIAVIAHADVVSAYVVEDGQLVMRGNVGFPSSAVGSVKLRKGEGIVGTVASVMRPISASNAKKDAHYKHVPELNEERYPSLLAVPMFIQGAVAGVMVLQRAEATDFTDTEVALATVLATTLTHAIEQHRDERLTEFTRSARLTGHIASKGEALGRAVMFGTLESIDERAARESGAVDRVASAFEHVSTIMRKGFRKVEKDLDPPLQRRLHTQILVLDDQRLQSTTKERCSELGMIAGLQQVAREYASAIYAGGQGDPFLRERAEEIEALCLLVAIVACDLPCPTAGSILVVPEELTAAFALAVIGWRGEGVVAGSAQRLDSLGEGIIRAGNLPMLDDVQGLFAWVRQGDTLLLSANDGVLRVNPPATQIARHRNDLKSV